MNIFYTAEISNDIAIILQRFNSIANVAVSLLNVLLNEFFV